MTPARVFSVRFEQVAEAVRAPVEKNLFDLPIALRQLLVDGTPLAHVVNREHQVKLQFEVGMSVRERAQEMAELGLPEATTHFLGTFPPNERRVALSLKDFLKFECLKVEGRFYTVHALIDVCANRLGGVHFDPADGDVAAADLQHLTGILELVGWGNAFSVLLVVAKTTEAALRPLYNLTSA